VRILINGRARDVREGATIAELLEEIGTPPIGIAVAHNEAVVRRAAFDDARLETGDRVEIIKAVAGG
jgi:sulfur carrier protein